MSAVDHWRRQLEAWRLPDEVLEAAPRSPYAWPAELFARMPTRDSTAATGEVLERLVPPAGSLLDVGAGTGRVSLPLAATGRRLTAVEPSPGMAERLRTEAAGLGVDVALVEQPWPGAAALVDVHDVTVSANVVYDVADIGPFLAALHHKSRLAVVVELTASHPWSRMVPYYRMLHGVELPAGPTAEDFAAVIREVAGTDPQRASRSAPPAFVFADRTELLDFYQTRLCVPDARRPELELLLDPDIVATPPGAVLGRSDRTTETMWWHIRPDDS